MVPDGWELRRGDWRGWDWIQGLDDDKVTRFKTRLKLGDGGNI